MMRRTAVAVIALFVIFSTAGIVGASFIPLHTTAVNQEATPSANLTVNLDFPYKYAGTLKLLVNGTGSPQQNSISEKGYKITLMFPGASLELDVAISPTSILSLKTNITAKLNGGVVASWAVEAPVDDTTGIALNSLALLPHNITATNLTLYLSNGQTLSTLLDNLVPNGFTGLRVYDCYNASYTVNSISAYRYSTLLTGLTVKDENTGGLVQTFDFAEGSNYVRVYDVLGNYIARTYYVASGSSLTAYLVQYSDGSWYTIYAGGNYINQTLQVLRNFDGTWVLVAEGRFDTTGTTSVFLTNGATYMFRILNPEGDTVLQTTKTANPTQPTITLAGSLEGVDVVLDPLYGVAWVIAPSDGYLLANETQNITVSFVGQVTITEATLTAVGDGVNVTKTVAFNSTSGQFAINVTPALPNQYVYTTLTLKFSDGGVLQRTRTFYVIPASQGNNSLLSVARTAPEELGLGPVAQALVATVIALMAALAVGRYSGSGGALVVGVLTWIFFAYIGWIDWRIVMISALAGVGLMVRRGEA